MDSLRHIDKRRKLMRAGKNQPIQLDDWDDEKAQAVRNLYADPDDQSKIEETREPQKELNETQARETLRMSEQSSKVNELNEF